MHYLHLHTLYPTADAPQDEDAQNTHLLSPDDPNAVFSDDDLILLAYTADTLSHFYGRPVLAQLCLLDDGYETVMFALPEGIGHDIPALSKRLCFGGAGTEMLGRKSSLAFHPQAHYYGYLLFALQYTNQPYPAYRLLDSNLQAVSVSRQLGDLVPLRLDRNVYYEPTGLGQSNALRPSYDAMEEAFGHPELPVRTLFERMPHPNPAYRFDDFPRPGEPLPTEVVKTPQ